VGGKVAYYKALIAKKKDKAHLNLDGREVPVTTNVFKMASKILQPFVEVIELIK